MNLTPHFTLEELTMTSHRQFDNTPNAAETANLTRLAQFLELVKAKLDNKPIMVNSAFRSKQVNDSVGSKDTSQHRLGCAADIRVPGMTPDQVVRAIMGHGLYFDQIIRLSLTKQALDHLPDSWENELCLYRKFNSSPV